jgi:hypothetical protein
MDRFWQDAVQVLETATQGHADLAVLVDRCGALRIVDGAGWRPDALQAHYGARTVFQVSHNGPSTRVTGRRDRHSCSIETSRPGLGAAFRREELALYTILPPAITVSR